MSAQLDRETHTLSCFDREHGRDPHAVRIAVDRDDAARILAQDKRDRERGIADKTIGGYVSVTDRNSGKRYAVAWHPCGGGCRCAFVALEAK